MSIEGGVGGGEVGVAGEPKGVKPADPLRLKEQCYAFNMWHRQSQAQSTE